MFKRKKLTILSIAVIFITVWAGMSFAGAAGKININTATADELVKLDRIGPKYAAKIIEYREKTGPFEKPEDIMNIKGIGQKAWEANKDIIITAPLNEESPQQQ